MANSIEIPIENEYNYRGEVKITDFAILGFDIKDNIVNLFFYMTDDKSVDYLFRTSFFIEKPEEELKYFNAKIHSKINMNLMEEDDRKIIQEYIKNIPIENNYYSIFNPIGFMTDNDKDFYKYIKCVGTNHTKDSNKQNIIKINIPFSIFLRIQIVKNRIYYNIPLDVSIDDDKRFNNICIHNNCILNYIGCSVLTQTIVEYFSLTIENDKKIGLISCIPEVPGKIIKSNTVTGEQISALYKEIVPVNLANIIIMNWVDTNKLCIFVYGEELITLYILTEDPKDCKLLKPYDLIY